MACPLTALPPLPRSPPHSPFAALVRLLSPRAKGDAILIVGPMDAGKTTLFLRLRDGSTHNGTVASMQPNEGTTVLRGDPRSARPVRLVDIPGHPRLRREFDRYANSARGVVFLIDAVDFMPKKTDAAE